MTSIRLGPHELPNRVFAAPMAGVTDRPFRRLCRQLGAGYAVSEMAASNPRLWASEKTARRLDHAGEAAPVAIHKGTQPRMNANDVIRIGRNRNFAPSMAASLMLTPCSCRCTANSTIRIAFLPSRPTSMTRIVACGSALLRDELLVARILEAVVGAVTVPVTLKFRTGWDPQHRNAVRIAQIAEAAGIQMLTLHGRSRACGFGGTAEYETIAAVKRAVGIPVVARMKAARGDGFKIWPFDTGWKPLREADLDGVEVVAAEVYPSLIKSEPQPGEVKDQAQVRTLCHHFARLDEAGRLGPAFGPAKDFPADAVLDVEHEEGWVLGA